jgi:hypothetical protein
MMLFNCLHVLQTRPPIVFPKGAGADDVTASASTPNTFSHFRMVRQIVLGCVVVRRLLFCKYSCSANTAALQYFANTPILQTVLVYSGEQAEVVEYVGQLDVPSMQA